MKIYTDENMESAIVAGLRRRGIYIFTAKELGFLVSCQACHAGRDPASKTAWIPACAVLTILGHTTSYG
jgi:hypothetical protein